MAKNLVYDIHEKPRFNQLIIFAIQQLLAIMAATIAVPAIVGNGMSASAAMFGAGSTPLVSAEFGYYMRSYGLLIVAALIGATPAVKTLVLKAKEHKSLDKIINLLEPLVLMALLVTVTAFLVDGSFNPFLYFRF